MLPLKQNSPGGNERRGRPETREGSSHKVTITPDGQQPEDHRSRQSRMRRTRYHAWEQLTLHFSKLLPRALLQVIWQYPSMLPFLPYVFIVHLQQANQKSGQLVHTHRLLSLTFSWQPWSQDLHPRVWLLGYNLTTTTRYPRIQLFGNTVEPGK